MEIVETFSSVIMSYPIREGVLTERIKKLLKNCNFHPSQWQVLQGDASSRHYIRVGDGQRTLIIMAYCAKEIGERFIKAQILLKGLGVRVPEILAYETKPDIADPLIILEDLGDETFGALVDKGQGQNRLSYYQLALEVLTHIQHHFQPTENLPFIYDTFLWLDQLRLFPQMLQVDSAGTQAFMAIWQDLLKDLGQQPKTLILRDYHLGNLMWLPNQQGINSCGVLDFQDAGLGHPLYDVVSLLEEARRDLPQTERDFLLNNYQKTSPFAFDQIWYHRLAAMRHCRVLAVFTRLHVQGKTQYHQHIPRLWRLLSVHLTYPDLKDLRQWFQHYLPNNLDGR